MLKKIIIFLTLAEVVLFALTYFSSTHLGDLFINLNMHFIICAVVLAIALAVLRMRKVMIIPLVVIALAIPRMAPLYGKITTPEGNYEEVEALQFNQLFCNSEIHKFTSYLETPENRVDFISWVEFGNLARAQAQELKKLYPYQVIAEQKLENRQIAFLSRFPIKAAWIININAENNRPLIIADVTTPENNALRIYVYHASNPCLPAPFHSRNQELARIAELVSRDRSKNIMVMGDFNMTSYSPWMRRFLHDSGLKNSQAGFGLQNSWPNYALFNIFRISIDQIFVSKNLEVKEWRVIESSFGSDHLPVRVRVLVRN